MSVYSKELIDILTRGQKERFPDYEYLTVEETEKVLDSGQFRIGKGHYWNEVEILYKDRWLGICQTSLMDNVATGTDRKVMNEEDIKRVVADFRGRINFGARIHSKYDSFCVITHTTDG